MPPTQLTVTFFCSNAGTEYVRDWLLSLPAPERKVIGEDIKTVQIGWPLGMPLVRKMEADLWEIRVTLPRKIARILFTLKDNKMVLLHGFIKKSQTTPKDDLHTAIKRLKQLKGSAS